MSNIELIARRPNYAVSAITLAVLSAAVALPMPAKANTSCNTKRPRSGIGGFLTGVADRAARRLGASGIVGDVLAEGKKLLTDSIACALNDAERAKALASQSAALNGKKIGAASRSTWASGDRPGVGGGSLIVSRSVTAGQQCAVQRTFITDVDGEQKSVEREMCQGPDGTWAAA